MLDDDDDEAQDRRARRDGARGRGAQGPAQDEGSERTVRLWPQLADILRDYLNARTARDVLDGRRAEVMEFRVEQHRDTHMKDGTTLTATMERLFGTKVGTTIEVVS